MDPFYFYSSNKQEESLITSITNQLDNKRNDAIILCKIVLLCPLDAMESNQGSCERYSRFQGRIVESLTENNLFGVNEKY